MTFFKKLGVFSKKNQAAKGFQPRKASQQTFILEPLITPSGLVDSVDHTPHPLELDLHTTALPEVHLPDTDTTHTLDHAVSHTVDSHPTTESIPHPVEQTNATTVAALNLHTVTDHAEILAAHTVETPLADHQLEVLPFLHNTSVDTHSANTLDSTFTSGVFTVGAKGEVSFNYLFDGGQYQGQVAIFNMEGMDKFVPGSTEFIHEAASRALSDSNLGHIVMSDATQGARFSGLMGGELQDWNAGEYQGVKTFAMEKGSTFGIMLVPNGTVQQVFDGNTCGDLHPLFSMTTDNLNQAFHVGQIADVNGHGNTFVMEDVRMDGGSDHDYNDMVFQIQGATGKAVHMDQVVDHSHDWRQTELGGKLMEFIKPPENQPLIGVIDTGVAAHNPDINPYQIHFGAHSDYVAGDGNPLLQPNEGSEHGTHVTGIIAATQDNGVGIDGINDQAPIYVARATGSGHWAQALTDFVDTAKESGQPHAIANLSLDLTQVNPDGSVTTRYEFTPVERVALEYARQNGVLIVAASGNDGAVMSALGQASQEFDNIITVGAVDSHGARADYSSFGQGLDLVAPGGTVNEPVISTVGSGADIDWLNAQLDQLTKEVDVPQDSMSVMAQTTFEEVFTPLKSSFGQELHIMAESSTAEQPFISTVHSGTDFHSLSANLDLPKELTSTTEQIPLMEAFSAFSAVGTLGTDAPNLPEDLTPEERQAYDEAVKQIDNLVFDYLDAASVKVSLELLDQYFAAGLDVTSRFLDTFDENFAETLLKAQEAVGDTANNPDTSTPNDLDFSLPMDLGVGAMFGTSVATAKVTGAASLVWAANPGLNYTQVKDILKRTAVDLNTPGWDEETGSGLVNIEAAVELAKNTTPLTYQPKPLLSPLTWTGEGKVIPSERAAEASEYKGKYYEWVEYTVREGDSLWKIAALPQTLGKGIDWPFIYEHNRSAIGSNPNRLNPGQKIFIPVEDPGYLQRQEEERKRQEELKKAEEERKKAEEELKKAEEELKRIEEEEKKKAAEEERRRQELFQLLVKEVSQKHGELGSFLGSWVSNGVTIYQFATGQLLMQPDGRYAFYQQTLKAVKELIGGSKLITENIVDAKGFWQTLEKPSKAVFELLSPGSLKEIFTQPNGLVGGSALDLTARLFPAEFITGAAKTREFFVDGKGKEIAGIAKSVAKFSDQADEYLLKASGLGKLGKFGMAAAKLNVLIDLGITALDVAIAPTNAEKGRAAVKGGASIIAGVVGTAFGTPLVGAGASIATSLAFDAGFWVADSLGYGDEVDNAIGSVGQAIGNGVNAVSSFASSAVNAAKEKAQAAVEKAKAAAEKAKATVQQAQVAYQNFKVEAQKAVTQITQKAEKVLKEGATNIYNSIVQQAPRVAQYVANYANQAIKKASEFIDNTKQFVSNAIETGKQFVNNLIETGKQAYETVKNFVVEKVEQGKQIVTETVKNAVNTVSNVVSGITNPLKSLFGW